MYKKICSILLSISVVFSLITAHASADTGTHIIINQVYGGGASADRTAPVSHSFVELYNPTDNTVDLSGWSVQYCSEGSSWSVLPLEGKIEPKHSYLIRGALHNSGARLQIDKYDAVWSTAFNNKGLKILLKNNTQASRSKNPYESNETGYVDMVGVAGNEYYYFIDRYETDYSQIQSKQKAIRRTKFTDTDNNAKDFSAIDYRTADLNEVRPRCSSDGAWTYTEFERSKGITKIPLEEKNTEFSFLHLSDTQASTAGTVDSIFTYDEDDYFTVNGTSYRFSKSYYNTYNAGESAGFSNIHTGDYIEFYLDYDERIAYISTVADSEGYDLPSAVNGNVVSFEYDGKTVNHIYDNNTKVYRVENGRKITVTADSIENIINRDRVFIVVKDGVIDEIYIWKNA